MMMKQKITLYFLFVFLITPGMAFSEESEVENQVQRALDWTAAGRAGGAHVFSAEPLPSGTFGMGFKESYFQARTIPYANTNSFHGNQIFLSYAPLSFLQFFLNRESFVLNNRVFFPAVTSQYFSKTEIGTQYAREVMKNYTVGLAPSYTFLNANGISGTESYGLGVGLLNTYRTEVGVRRYPLRFHVNLGYFKDQSQKFFDKFDFESVRQDQIHGLSRFDAIHYGIGLQLEAPTVHPYLEYTMDQMLSSKVPLFQNPNQLTIGSKIVPKSLSHVQFDLGADLGLTTQRFKHVSITPQFKLFAGVAYILPGKAAPKKRPEEKEDVARPEAPEIEPEMEPEMEEEAPPMTEEAPQAEEMKEKEEQKEEETEIKKIQPLSPEELKKYPISRAKPVHKIVRKAPSKPPKKEVEVSIPEITTGIPSFNEDIPLEELEDRNYEQDSPNGDFIRYFR